MSRGSYIALRRCAHSKMTYAPGPHELIGFYVMQLRDVPNRHGPLLI